MPSRTVDWSAVPYVSGAVVESPVGLVIVESEGRRNAMTVSFFSEVAHYPTSMWISIARDSHTHSLLSGAGRFSFITLHQGQGPIAIACGTASGRDRDKCSALDLYDNGEGFLFLKGALASTACRIASATRVGDHTLFIAHMLSGHISPGGRASRQLLLSDLRQA
jgi:flavin reductase (DIM6/NTAB) family NADH-FMN oxidoreductase RutF